MQGLSKDPPIDALRPSSGGRDGHLGAPLTGQGGLGADLDEMATRPALQTRTDGGVFDRQITLIPPVGQPIGLLICPEPATCAQICDG